MSMGDREDIAEVQHGIWSSWMKYLFTQGRFERDGSFVIPVDKVQRWKNQIATEYRDLTEKEKDSDRDQADKVLAVLLDVLDSGKDPP